MRNPSVLWYMYSGAPFAAVGRTPSELMPYGLRPTVVLGCGTKSDGQQLWD